MGMRSTRGRYRDSEAYGPRAASHGYHFASSVFITIVSLGLGSCVAISLHQSFSSRFQNIALWTCALLPVFLLLARQSRGAFRGQGSKRLAYVAGIAFIWIGMVQIAPAGFLPRAAYRPAFQSEAWRESATATGGGNYEGSPTRLEMVGDLRASGILLGLSQDEVHELLGPAISYAPARGSNGTLVYMLGSSPGAIGPDVSLLHVEFEHGLVSRTWIRHG